MRLGTQGSGDAPIALSGISVDPATDSAMRIGGREFRYWQRKRICHRCRLLGPQLRGEAPYAFTGTVKEVIFDLKRSS